MRLSIACLIALFAGCSCSPDGNPPKSEFGRFDGQVNATWDGDGRNMTLNEGFAYIDPNDKRWSAPSGSVVNGASIPKPFWSVIGGPFEGQYRNASVVHDVACDEMKESWEAVHRMFYNACRCGGVSNSKSKLMYWAVYQFGPRWREVQETRIETRIEDGQEVQIEVVVSRNVRDDPPPPDNEDVVRRAEQYFESNDPSLADIESLEL